MKTFQAGKNFPLEVRARVLKIPGINKPSPRYVLWSSLPHSVLQFSRKKFLGLRSMFTLDTWLRTRIFGLCKGNIDSDNFRAISSTTMMSPVATSSRFAESRPLSRVAADSFKPASWFIWEQIRDWFDFRIKKLGVRNCAFPLFVSEDVLQREKAHIEGFAAEVAWVTHA